MVAESTDGFCAHALACLMIDTAFHFG
jgi:hypothetical protein